MDTMMTWIKNWKLRSFRTAAVAAFVIYTVAGFFVVPVIAERVIEKQSMSILGRQATVENIRCNPFTLSLTIEGFSIPDRPGSELLAFDSLYANAQVSSIFRWAATLKELRITQPSIAVRRFSDGGVNLLEVWEDLKSDTEGAESQGLPRALLQAIIIEGGALLIEDNAREQALVWNWTPIDFTLHGISTLPDDQGDEAGTIGLPAGGTLSASGSITLDPLGLEGTLQVDQVSLSHAWEALQEWFEFSMEEGTLNTDFHYKAALLEDGLHLDVGGLNAELTDIELSTPGKNLGSLTVESISVTDFGATWPSQDIHGESIVISGVEALGSLSEDRVPFWRNLIPEPTQEAIVKTYESVKDQIHLTASLGRFELHDAKATFEDRSQKPPVTIKTGGSNVVVTNISTDEGSLWPFEANTSLLGASSISATGSFGPRPITLQAEFNAEDIDLSRLQTYLALIAPIELQSAVMRAQGAVSASTADGEMAASFEGSFGLAEFKLRETLYDNDVLDWTDLSVDGIKAQLEPMSLDINTIDIDGAGLGITITPEGSINLLDLVADVKERLAPEGTQERAQEPSEETSSASLPPVRVARIRLNDCSGTLTDQTFDEAFVMGLSGLEGSITGVATQSKAAAEVDFGGTIDTGGTLTIKGQIDPLDITRLTDLDVDLRRIVMPPLSPMSVKFIGHGLTDGDTDLDLDYTISDGDLVGANHIEADDLELGDKVEDQGMINLPFKLGLALLKDSEGRITLDIPLEADLSDHELEMSAVIKSAVKEVVSELVKSPFRLLSKIGGSGDEDLEYVDFAAGASRLEAAAITNLEILAAALAERPTLLLSIEGTVDPTADAEALQHAALNAELLANGATEEQMTTVIPLDILTKMYRDHFSGDQLKALEATHTPPSKDLDEIAFRQALRQALTDSQPVDSAQVRALGPARAQAIRQFLVEQEQLDGNRITISPETAEQKSDGSWVACLLAIEPE